MHVEEPQYLEIMPGETHEEKGLKSLHCAQNFQVTQALDLYRTLETFEHWWVKRPQTYKEKEWLRFD